MDFRIADTFTEGLAKLTPYEQKAVKAIAFRFFPLIEHEELGLALHPFDLAQKVFCDSVRQILQGIFPSSGGTSI